MLITMDSSSEYVFKQGVLLPPEMLSSAQILYISY